MEKCANKLWFVYKHTSPSGKVYIGITTNIKNRWACKGRYYCTYNSIFKNAIEKYGWDAIKHEVILENIPKSEANYAEKYLIKWYKLHNLSYNVTDGGDGHLGMVVSPETREKASKSNKGKHPYNPKAIEASKNAVSRMSEEERRRIFTSYGMLGKHHTDEARLKQSLAAKGRDMSKAIEAARHANRVGPIKSVIQFDINNKIINIFPSITEAKKALGKTSNSIANCLKGRAETAFGYKWGYK